MPTVLERKGDFSQTYDNTGAPYPYIKDPNLSGACTSASQVACFADGGVLGRIPANRLYATGLAILNWWPTPNINGAGLAYNYELTRPVEKPLGYQPVLRVDYQPMSTLRLGAKYAAYGQRPQTFLGSLLFHRHAAEPHDHAVDAADRELQPESDHVPGRGRPAIHRNSRKAAPSRAAAATSAPRSAPVRFRSPRRRTTRRPVSAICRCCSRTPK
jgi:hypothetical protein